MFCSGCGHTIEAGQTFCNQCGRPVAPPVPPMPGLQFQVDNFAGKVRSLSVVWFLYAGFAFLSGIAHLTFAHAFFSHNFGNWDNGPWPGGPGVFGPMFMGFAWTTLMVRSALAAIAAWGLYERAPWGRIVAIVAAFVTMFSFSHILFGTAIGIWTLVVLLGYRNATLYEELQ